MIKGLKRLWSDRQRADAGAADEPSAPALRVLMVCMGNICRSPTAEAVLRAQLQRASLADKVLVDSAGTHGYHTGEPPDPRAIARGRQRGYALDGLRARPVHEQDFARFDLILAMDEANLAWLQRKAPEAAAGRLGLLMTYASRHPGVTAVPDPYYGAPEGFDRVLDLVEDACAGLLPRLTSEANALAAVEETAPETAPPSGSAAAKLE
jgi:protein-tyrosine phosphatase